MMKLPMFGQLTFEKIMPLLIGAVFLIAVVIVLNKIVKNIFFQSAYLETLREFAETHGYKKPISKWGFILIEIAGVFVALFFITSFFKNAFVTTGILAALVLLSVFVAVKYYTPPFKAFALAEHLTYNGDLISGNFKGRDILMKMEKESVEFPQETLWDRNQRVDIVKRSISVSLSLDHESIKGMAYKNGKIEVTPGTLKADFSPVEKMLLKMPAADNVRLYISTLNGKEFLTLKKMNNNFLFIAELYYLCKAAGRTIDALNDGLARCSQNGQ